MTKSHLRLVAPREGVGTRSSTTSPREAYGLSPARPRRERLSEMVWHAARVVFPQSRGSVTLELQSVPAGPSEPVVALNVLCRARSLAEYDGITARIQVPRFGRQRAKRALALALERYGGSHFVGLTAAHDNGGLDATIAFPYRLPFIAHNVVSVPHLMLVEQAELYAELLDTLGIAHSAQHSTFRVPRMQLRRMPEPARLLDAFGVALPRCRAASLYAAELPLRQSMRAEHRSGTKGYFDLTLSRGLSSAAPCTLIDCDEMGAFLEQCCGISIADLEWHVTARFWAREPAAQALPSSNVSH
jgi:hypothetical protein